MTKIPTSGPLLRPQLAMAIARRLPLVFPNYCARSLTNPVFAVGFNNSGKSTIVRELAAQRDIAVYPDEGNSDLWFPGFFPWTRTTGHPTPIWYDPGKFVSAVLASRTDGFRAAQQQLGAYQALRRAGVLINDSGMLAALAPAVARAIPQCRFIHFVRDGRLAVYVTAKLEWSAMVRTPTPYEQAGCLMGFHEMLERMARYWAWTVRQLDLLRRSAPSSVLEVRYETWLESPQRALRQITDFIGVAAKLPGPNVAPGDEISSFLFRTMSSRSREILERELGPLLIEKGYRPTAH